MRSLSLRAAALFGVLCLGFSGCSDNAAAPERVATGLQPGAPSHGLISDVLQVLLLQRLLPLGQDYSASATIGPGGGTIAIPQAGMVITFPAGAVASPVTVRATALEGKNVAYDFEPHGLVFQKDPTITQALGLTQVVQNLLLANNLQGAYFANDADLGNGTATVTELRPAQVNLLLLKMSFTVHHFSGYAVSSGRQGGYITSSGDRSAGTTRGLAPGS